eukprot:scaffold135687_cov61-Attheya_sp.AAC.3
MTRMFHGWTMMRQSYHYCYYSYRYGLSWWWCYRDDGMIRNRYPKEYSGIDIGRIGRTVVRVPDVE